MAIERDINKKKKEREPVQKATPARPFRKQGLRSPTYTKRNPHRDSGDKKPSLKTKSSIIKEKAKKGQGLAKGGAVKMFQRRGMSGMAKIVDITSKFLPTPRSGTISTIESPAKKFVDIRTRVKKAGGYANGGSPRRRIQTAEEKKRMEEAKKLFNFTGKRPPLPKIDRSDKTKFYRQRAVTKKAMGGQAQEGVARGRVFADQKARDRQRLLDMLERLKKKPGGTRPKNPKTKKEDPKKFMDRPILPKDKPKPKPVRPFLPKGKPKGKPQRAK